MRRKTKKESVYCFIFLVLVLGGVCFVDLGWVFPCFGMREGKRNVEKVFKKCWIKIGV